MRHHNEVDDNDLDANGILKDGGRVRVNMMLMDSLDPVQKALAAAAAARPSPKRTGYVFDSDDSHATKMRAYDQAKVRLSNAYKGGLDVGDTVHYGGSLKVVDTNFDTGRMVLRDASKVDGKTTKQNAYDSCAADLADAWKKPPPKKREEEEEDPDDNEWRMAGPLSDSINQSISKCTLRRHI